MKHIFWCLVFLFFCNLVFAETDSVDSTYLSPNDVKLLRKTEWVGDNSLIWIKRINEGTLNEVVATVEVMGFPDNKTGTNQFLVIFMLMTHCTDDESYGVIFWRKNDSRGKRDGCGAIQEDVTVTLSFQEMLGQLPGEIVSNFGE